MGVTSSASAIKAGTVAWFAATTAPAGFIKANGAAVSRSLYAALFNVIGITYGAGDGSTTFNMPDLRGEFVRSLDDGRGVDSGRGLGTFQDSDNRSHTHGVNDPSHNHGVSDPGHNHQLARDISSGTAQALNVGQGISNYAPLGGVIQGSTTGIGINGNQTGISIQATGNTETRPRNVALLACIKF